MKKNLYELIATQEINSKADYDLFIQNADSIENDEMGKDARIKLNNEMFVEIYAADEEETEMDEYYTQSIRFYTEAEGDVNYSAALISEIIAELKESVIDEIAEEVENETEKLLESRLDKQADGFTTEYKIYLNKESGEIYGHEGSGRPASSDLIHIITIGDNLARFDDDGGFEEYLKESGIEFDEEMSYRELKELRCKEWEFYKESTISDIICDVREYAEDYANIRNKVKEIFN